MQDLQVVDKLSNQSDRLQKTTEKSTWLQILPQKKEDLNEKL